MQKRVQDVLKKINYIEVEAEIQKQILQSIPKNQHNDIEDVIKKIAAAKEQIHQLRKELRDISPQEYDKLVAIEKATAAFKELAEKTEFTFIESMSATPDCSITYRSGETESCLVKARDEKNNWTIITLDGKLLHLDASEVAAAEDGKTRH